MRSKGRLLTTLLLKYSCSCVSKSEKGRWRGSTRPSIWLCQSSVDVSCKFSKGKLTLSSKTKHSELKSLWLRIWIMSYLRRRISIIFLLIDWEIYNKIAPTSSKTRKNSLTPLKVRLRLKRNCNSWLYPLNSQYLIVGAPLILWREWPKK